MDEEGDAQYKGVAKVAVGDKSLEDYGISW